MSIRGTFVTNVLLIDIFTRHYVESEAHVSYFPFRCVGRISYILSRDHTWIYHIWVWHVVVFYPVGSAGVRYPDASYLWGLSACSPLLNVIIRSVITAILTLLTIWLWLGHNTHSGAGLNGIVQESLVAKESLRFAAHSRSYSEAESTSGYPWGDER